MRPFLRYLLFLAVILAITWIKVPQRYSMAFPRTLGPEFNRKIRDLYINELNAGQAEIVLLGDSTLKDGVDPEMLSMLTGKKILMIGVPGSASALWYLVLKNNIAVAEHQPRTVVVLFRDTILTAPGYRVQGGYFVQLDEFAGKNEPLLLERSYLNLMNPLEKLAERYFPVYGARGEIRKEMDGLIRYTLPGWLQCDRACTDDSMYNVFTSADLEPGQLQNAVATVESYLYTSSQLNFQRQVNKSYLPEMIRLTREHGIQLVLVRLRQQTFGRNNSDTAEIRRYIDKLSEYLDEQGVLFLDYGNDPRLIKEGYKDPLHLNEKGQMIFTEILADGLDKSLK